ncbi:ABC transporter substrate-binding protein [Meiothermus granaticius]|uniref:Spermidine-binding periplasmic protein SpuE n=1 Tax=Meiothermus granaticius NBRC 107808 TaxID=1227551 RepID=A0A399FAU1_9DEIN|nr:spermidine/putrescine ABC transporter substrate-binding protein [Meiothermus granaticius]RIH93233.1 Spermidine-binding periplasmic protein SpuE [Meiothermus granaticius NBRC 107808]GEM86448.1 spermidine/putrescine ABC transporter substrate-binding protein [Meiothermus granaticius NBRC 107808]
MKRVLALLAFTTLALAQPKELRLYTWTEYIEPAIISDFEKATGIKVRISYYESNEELLAKLQAGGDSQYDVIVPSDFIIPAMIQLRLLKPLDPAKIPNLKNLDPKFKSPPFDPGNQYTVGYLWGTVGLMYNTQVFKTPPQSWAVLFDPAQQKGRFTLMDSQREMLGIGLRYIGQSVNSTDTAALKKVIDLLLQAKNSKNSLGFQGGVSATKLLLGNQAVAAVVYNQDALRTAGGNPKYGFTIPKEGSTLFLDNMAIPARAPNPEAAHRFINFILDAKIGARLANYQNSATPNAAAKPLMKPELLKNPAVWPTEAQMKVLEFILPQGEKDKLYDEAWTRIKSR